MKFYTIGHSTHSQEEFVHMLKQYKIERLVDVRSYPGSRYIPHFNKENMEIWVPENDIEYLHLRNLGGRRRLYKDIDEDLINAWESASFRNYASYTLTDDYNQALEHLISLGEEKTLAYMCSEAVPWRCHRLLISNNLVVKGKDVYHIFSDKEVRRHELGIYGAPAVEKKGLVIYPKIKAEDQ